MAIQLHARPAPLPPIESLPYPAASSLCKLDRLRELRAAIDCLRSEREAQDPLVAWILAREQAENA